MLNVQNCFSIEQERIRTETAAHLKRSVLAVRLLPEVIQIVTVLRSQDRIKDNMKKRIKHKAKHCK